MRRKATIVLLCLLAVALGFWASYTPENDANPDAAISLAAITVLPSGRALPEFSLVDKTGQRVGRDAFAQRWSLVFLGFTHCGDVCPLTMAQMRPIQESIDEPLQMVFISVDPGRDTPAIIEQYVGNYDPGFQGMTGTPDELKRFASAVGAAFFVDESPDRYVVDHSAALFLIGPDASLRGVITPPLDVPLIVQDLSAIL